MVLSWVGGDCAGVLTVRVKQAVVRIERGWAKVKQAVVRIERGWARVKQAVVRIERGWARG